MSWRETIFKTEERNEPAIVDVVSAMEKTHAGGGTISRCFRPIIGPAKHGYPEDAAAVRAFLEEESVRAALPELQLPPSIDPFPPAVRYGAYEFEGAITSLLRSNGAYVSSTLTDDEARGCCRRPGTERKSGGSTGPGANGSTTSWGMRRSSSTTNKQNAGG
jgi:hypothetical protein